MRWGRLAYDSTRRQVGVVRLPILPIFVADRYPIVPYLNRVAWGGNSGWSLITILRVNPVARLSTRS